MIVAVAGGKGGVGKTTVAFNLAAELDAVAVDADLGMADLPGGRGPDLHDVLAGRASPLEAVRWCGSVAVVPCGRTLAGTRAADPRRLVEVVRRIDEEYGAVVVDSPAGMAADVGLALAVADLCVLVTTPEEPGVADALRTRALARELDTGLRAVTLNRCGPDPPVGPIREVFGAPVVPILESETVARAQRNGRPVRAVAPGREPADRLEELAERVRSWARRDSRCSGTRDVARGR